MGFLERIFVPVLFFSTTATSQLPSSRCDALPVALKDCPEITASSRSSMTRDRIDARTATSLRVVTSDGRDDEQSDAFIASPPSRREEHFHWGRALFESFTFLAIEQAYVVKDDYRWVTVENGVPFNHYWRDYKQSLSTWIHSGWNDGDPALYSYLGHPIQGAFTGYIQVQNDPAGEKLEFSKTREYWRSRMKALLWNTVYSTQWNIGPLSELTFEKDGSWARPPWNHDGTWPCHEKHCFTGAGQVDLVTTPVGGFAWMIMEDVLDKEVARRV